MSPSPERRYASLAKAARYADCTERTLYNHIKSGEITGYKVGRVYRIDLAEIDLWMARDAIHREVEAAPPLTEAQRARLAALFSGGR